MKYLSRKDWGARSARSRLTISNLKGIGVHTNGPAMKISDHSQCVDRVKSIQNFHMSNRGWADVAYSWLVCIHGVIYEGRGWGVRTAANGTTAGNAYYHAVMMLGGNNEVTENAKEGLKAVIDEHQRRYPNANQVRPHSFFKATSCPGDDLRKWISDGMPLGEKTSDTPKSPPAPKPTTPSRDYVTVGDKGTEVRSWQSDLRKWNSSALPRFGVDGDFGAETRTWTLRFYDAVGMSVADRNRPRVGPATREAMKKALARPRFSFRYTALVKRGSARTAAVREWQTALRRWNGNALPRFGADGDFGPETEDWTKRFQRAAKIAVDGIVGPQTRGAMEKALN